MKYRTKQGDLVDDICFRLYGNSEQTPTIYQQNPGLSSYGPVLPAGLLLTLPEPSTVTTTTQPKVSLFD